MSLDHLIYFIVLALIAEIIGTLGGFGSSLLFVPIAGFFLDFHSVLGITALFHVASNISKITLFRKGVNIKLILTIGIPSFLFVGLGAYLSRFYHSQYLQVILSCFLIVVSVLLIVLKNLKLKPTLFNSLTGGSLSGFAAGLLGTGGAIRGITLAAFNLEKNCFIATSAVIDLGVDLTRTAIYGSNGFIHIHDLYLVLILLIVSFAGTYIGKLLIDRFSDKQFKFGVLALIFITGVVTLVKQLM